MDTPNSYNIDDPNDEGRRNGRRKSAFVERHPILSNLAIIILVAVLGIVIIYMSIALFTKHGEHDKVPKVENLSYTEAIRTLNDAGFRVEIRDSLYRDDVKPGFVIEQYPKSNSIVKPGRKVFLYINAVHPKEVVIDDDNHPAQLALKNYSERQGLSHLEELGFKNVRVVKVLGDNDCIVRVLANGRPVRKMQKVPVNAKLVVEVYDGRLGFLRDSLQNEELRSMGRNDFFDYEPMDENSPYDYDYVPPYPPEERKQPTTDPNAEDKGRGNSEGEEMEVNNELME